MCMQDILPGGEGDFGSQISHGVLVGIDDRISAIKTCKVSSSRQIKLGLEGTDKPKFWCAPDLHIACAVTEEICSPLLLEPKCQVPHLQVSLEAMRGWA